MKKKISIIGQFPPPLHGLSKALEVIYTSPLATKYSFEKINITDNRKILKTLLKIIKSNSDLFYFTISQTKGGNWRDLLILKIIFLKKKKCLIHLHGGYYRELLDKEMNWLQKKINYKYFSYLDGAIVLGPSLRQIFEGIIDESKIFIVPNCTENSMVISNDELEDKLNCFNKNEINLLYLSNFIKSKGYMMVLEMAKVAKIKNATYIFNFAGKFFNREDREDFFKYIKDNNLSDIVKYHGIVEGKNKKELLRKSSFFILPTFYPKEGQPISILEAMGNGLVILSTKHSGIPDIVEDKVNGYLLSKGQCSPEILYKKINSLKPEDIKHIMCKNVQKVKVNFNEEKYLQNMDTIFASIINSKKW